jgi:hypothetical protein
MYFKIINLPVRRPERASCMLHRARARAERELATLAAHRSVAARTNAACRLQVPSAPSSPMPPPRVLPPLLLMSLLLPGHAIDNGLGRVPP